MLAHHYTLALTLLGIVLWFGWLFIPQLIGTFLHNPKYHFKPIMPPDYYERTFAAKVQRLGRKKLW